MAGEGFKKGDPSEASFLLRRAKLVALTEMLSGAGLVAFGGIPGLIAGGVLLTQGIIRMVSALSYGNDNSFGIIGLAGRIVLFNLLSKDIKFK